MNTKDKRYTGILCHITSLPSSFGIGDLGPEAYDFVTLLSKHDLHLLQILPIGPTGYGNSPYSSRSAFAGNEYLISPLLLAQEGLIKESELEEIKAPESSHVNFSTVETKKLPLLRKAAARFLAKGRNEDFETFKEKNRYWLDDYALFMCAYTIHYDARYYLWDKEEKECDPLWADQMRTSPVYQEYVALQYFFDSQWQKFKAHANVSGIAIIGDIPIYASRDSADCYAHPNLFSTSEVSGVPPDCFSTTGQLWGNPIYRWSVMEEDGFSWWRERLHRLSEEMDIIRIDHFKGFESYYAIPSEHKTAEQGRWIKGPGIKFFRTIKESLPDVKIIAEDLGSCTKELDELRDACGFPGMRIGQFGFALENGSLNAKDTFLMHNYPFFSVAYTGTHDNDTVRGWFEKQNKPLQMAVMAYLACKEEEVSQKMIRQIMASHAMMAIFPIQDILDLDTSARMNTPATVSDANWTWKLTQKDIPALEEALSLLERDIKLFGRTATIRPDESLR